MKSMLMLLLLFVAGGCAVVREPVGDKPLNIQAERDAWEGVWLMDGQIPVTVKVFDGSNGVLQVGWIQDDDDGNMELKTAAVHLREGGGWTFATLIPVGYEDDIFLWGRMVRNERQCVVWLPSVGRIRSLVDKGLLPGDDGESPDGTSKPGVELGTLGPDHLKLLTSDTHGVLFDWEPPFVFNKVGE